MNSHKRQGLVERQFPGLIGVRVKKGLYTIASRKVVSYPGERGPPLPRRGLYIYAGAYLLPAYLQARICWLNLLVDRNSRHANGRVNSD